ncbi:hypothetical protein EG68_02921 [Paragonimus skrjabini miyazakii]|uniref:B-cell CLL/lymphoma 7 protein family member A n=1 Tax=Paragonimus skrjabini miyazakii TaxID=59628 RepID=A0A8S9Z2G8_9TREM|nr:hypothetical protein EG68_02921 [Paragonimus skrjabini miyazakii]
MFSRSLRAETRSKTKEDLKRVNKSNGHVRSWEKKWVAVKDTSMLVFRWIPSVVMDTNHAKKTAFARQTSLNAVAAHGVNTGLLSTYSRQPCKPLNEQPPSNEATEFNANSTATPIEIVESEAGDSSNSSTKPEPSVVNGLEADVKNNPVNIQEHIETTTEVSSSELVTDADSTNAPTAEPSAE